MNKQKRKTRQDKLANFQKLRKGRSLHEVDHVKHKGKKTNLNS